MREIKRIMVGYEALMQPYYWFCFVKGTLRKPAVNNFDIPCTARVTGHSVLLRRDTTAARHVIALVLHLPVITCC